jgi:hypothetical protein
MLESRFTPYAFASARSTSSTVKLLEQDHGANHPIRSTGFHLAPRRGERCEKLQVAPRIGDIGETARSRGGLVRINSGSCLSPPFQLTGAPSVSPFPTRHLTHPAGEYFHSSVADGTMVLPYSGLARSGLDEHRFHQCSLDTRKPTLNDADGVLIGSFQR